VPVFFGQVERRAHHNGQAPGAFRADDAFDPVERLLEHVLVEEQDGGQGLVLRGCRHVLFDRQVREEAIRRLLRQAFGMLVPVKSR
jgi:hypothetical protein